MINLDTKTVIHLHDQIIRQFGGSPGLRDLNALESALHRAQFRAFYGCVDENSISRLAVDHAYGIFRNHPFVDGNKRIAFIAMELFLYLNNFSYDLEDYFAYQDFLGLIEGKKTVEEYAERLSRDLKFPRTNLVSGKS